MPNAMRMFCGRQCRATTVWVGKMVHCRGPAIASPTQLDPVPTSIWPLLNAGGPPRCHRKKGIRCIVTLECTESRKEGATPSRYTTEKVREEPDPHCTPAMTHRACPCCEPYSRPCPVHPLSSPQQPQPGPIGHAHHRRLARAWLNGPCVRTARVRGWSGNQWALVSRRNRARRDPKVERSHLLGSTGLSESPSWNGSVRNITLPVFSQRTI